jgi:hypothetical protein
MTAFPAGLAVMRQEFEEKEFGVAGEFMIGTQAPQTTRIERPRFPAPDWEQEAKEAREREHQEHGLDEETPNAYPPATRESAA